MGFLKAVLFILLGYYLFKFVIKMFAPRILGYAAKKTEERFRERFGDFGNFNKQQSQEDDNVIVNQKKNKKNDSSQKVGEYIDFEEID